MNQVESMDYINTEQLELWDHEYNVIRARWLKELFGDLPAVPAKPSETVFTSVPVDQEGRLVLNKLFEGLEQDLLRLSRQWMENRRQDEHTIFEIVKYIEANYAEDITLQDLADRFYLSREYISRKFKQQFQRTCPTTSNGPDG